MLLWIQSIPKWILSFLDWVVSLTERLMALAIAYLVFYVGWHILHPPIAQSLKDALQILPADWKLLLILMIPLFYRPIKMLLGRVKGLPGVDLEPPEKRETGSAEGE